MSNNNGWEDAKITEEGEEVVSKFSKLLEHKVDRREIMLWNVTIIGLCVSICFVVTKGQIDRLADKVVDQKAVIEKQESKLEKQEDKITNLLIEIERLKK